MRQEHIKYIPRIEPMPEQGRSVWKTVFTGEGLSAEEYQKLFSALRIEASSAAVRLIEHIKSEARQGLCNTKLVFETVAGLGFKRGEEFRAVQFALPRLGLTFCPPDTALVLRGEYSLLPVGETIRVLSQPVDVSGHPLIFAITRNFRGIALDAVELRPGDAFKPYERLVLAKSDIQLAD